MNRILAIVGLCHIGFALTATSVSAQYFRHDDYGHRYDVHAHLGHHHGRYHAAEYGTHPGHFHSYNSHPMYAEPVCGYGLDGEYDCPNSGYYPQAEYGLDQRYIPRPSLGPADDHAGHDHGYATPFQPARSLPQPRRDGASRAWERNPRFDVPPQRPFDGDSGTRGHTEPMEPQDQAQDAPIQMDGPPPPF